MKVKYLLCLAVAMSLVITMLPLGLVKAVPKFYLDPPTVIAPPPSVGGTLHVVLRTDAIPDLFLWVATIEWDPAVFQLVDGPDPDLLATPEEGATIKQTQPSFFTWTSLSAGKIDALTCTSLGVGVSVPPNPTDMAHLYFQVLSSSFGTYISITFARYIDTGSVEYEPNTEPLYFELIPPPPTDPTAAFTPAPESVFYEGVPVDFNAAASTGGYDGDDFTTITSYSWDFDGDGIFDELNNTGPTTSHVYTADTYYVTLEVYAPGIPPSIDPRYNATDTETHKIYIQVIPVGPNLDVYTERNGVGHGVPSDAFGPQEEVTLYAKVTYNSDPVANKLVAFEVKDNAGIPILTSTAPSNLDGIATTSFRIPWTGMEAETKFGTWCVYGAVDIAEQVATDYCPFEFGYIVSILSVETTDALEVSKGTFLKGEDLHVRVQLKDISYNSKTVLVTVTVYDDCGVPIGFVMIPSVLVPPGTSFFFDFGILIPYWRFKGTGRVYVNIFTAMPQSGGIPYCPEGSTIFTLG
jgi:hypothetical protein